MTDAGAQDVRTLISLLREIMKEDTKILAAITCDEAELEMGGTDLPTVRMLARELIDVARKALDALGGAEYHFDGMGEPTPSNEQTERKEENGKIHR